MIRKNVDETGKSEIVNLYKYRHLQHMVYWNLYPVLYFEAKTG